MKEELLEKSWEFLNRTKKLSEAPTEDKKSDSELKEELDPKIDLNNGLEM